MHRYKYDHICVYIYIYIYTYVHTYIHTYIYVQKQRLMNEVGRGRHDAGDARRADRGGRDSCAGFCHRAIHIYIYIYIHIYIHTYSYSYIYIYTYTHIRLWRPRSPQSSLIRYSIFKQRKCYNKHAINSIRNHRRMHTYA